LNKSKKNAADYETVQEILTEYELIIDSYEQVRERPRDNKEQEKFFSGKACKHTFKTQMAILPDASEES
jgi:5-bromo-4-chloroindolyl phosphate hydrolysis protein